VYHSPQHTVSVTDCTIIATIAYFISCWQNTNALAPWTTCFNLHQNRFIRFQNIVFTSLVINRLTNESIDGETNRLMDCRSRTYNMPTSASLARQRDKINRWVW